MKHWQGYGCLVLGLALGAAGMSFYGGVPKPVLAYNDRVDDCVLCTGQVLVDMKNTTVDGIWLLDYRAGILRGTIVDQSVGKVMPWYEIDLLQEFGIAPKQNVHFLMTPGNMINPPSFMMINNQKTPGNNPNNNMVKGHTAVYVAETVSGKFGVYAMSPNAMDPRAGVEIRRYDFTNFRSRP